MKVGILFIYITNGNQEGTPMYKTMLTKFYHVKREAIYLIVNSVLISKGDQK